MDTVAILRKAADACGFRRAKYVEKDMPTNPDNISAMLFLGDMRSSFVTSSLLLRRYREEVKGSKYFIVCSWPGYAGLFPYADEYWEIRDESVLQRLYAATDGFENKAPEYDIYKRSLNWHISDVADFENLKLYYSNGLTKEFVEKFRHVKVSLPSVPSGAILGTDFVRQMSRLSGEKVFIYPCLYFNYWHNGKLHKDKTPKGFWVECCNHLVKSGYRPVIYQNWLTHDISPELANESILVTEKSLSSVLGAMRLCSCVIDFYSGISRFCIAARSPFIAFDERLRYSSSKEYEVDDLCGRGLPGRYIFAFPTIIKDGNPFLWKANYYDLLTAKLNSFLPEVDRDQLPSTSELVEIVPYDNVRKIKNKRLGTRFVRVPKD